jgi:tungstate transport system substrate-binding protein
MFTKSLQHGIAIALMMVLLSACGPASPNVTQGASSAKPTTPANPEIILATTTSTQDSGLLDVLVPLFEKQTGYTIKVIAVGTGAALKMGEQGNADVLLVHAPTLEVPYMQQGYGIDRRLVMHNDFVIVGPADDPAGIKGVTTAEEAFKKIAAAKAPFVSRGDQSGTNTMELNIWKTAGITPAGDWYIQTGQGMGATLKIASEKGAYTLTDRATYLANKSILDLDILVQKDPVLLNIYHVIIVNPEKWPKINLAGARAWSDFLVSAGTQKVIAQFGVDKFGQALFFADANKTDADLGLKP